MKRLDRLSRRGFTLLELLFAAGIGLVVLAGGFELLLGMGRAEVRTDSTADVTTECAQAYSRLRQDLERLCYDPGDVPAWIQDDAGELTEGPGSAIQFLVPDPRDGHRVEVSYYLDLPSGSLVRSLDGEVRRRYHLGPTGEARFELHRGAPGSPAGFVEFRVQARNEDIGDGIRLALAGAIPLHEEISEGDFPFWNP